VESPLGQVDVASLGISVRVLKGHNFGSERWISLKSLQEFPNAVFLGLDMESPLGQVEVASLEISLRV
jgi:hypothetical protein